MIYKLTPTAKEHTRGHFIATNQVGSHFNCNVFPDIESLLNYIKDLSPVQQIIQKNGSYCDIYNLEELEFAGWVGLGKRKDFADLNVFSELRNGYVTSFAEVRQLPTTHLISVVYRTISEEAELITAFPGPYAPAFPSALMPEDERDSARRFWDEHILLKKIG